MTAIPFSDEPRHRLPISATAVAVRLAVVPLAAAGTLLLPALSAQVAALAAIGTLAAVCAPATVGALPLLVLEILCWLTGWSSGQASAGRIMAFAVLLYLLHVSTALAANVPWAAQIDTQVLSRWALRCVPGLLAALGCTAMIASVQAGTETVVLDIAALGSVAMIALALTWLATQR